MPGVLLVLGLIAAGVYTGAWGFYVAAGVLGFFYFLVMFIILAIASSVKEGVKELNNQKFKLR